MNGYREPGPGSLVYRIVFGVFALVYIAWGLLVFTSYALGECFPDHSCGTNRPAEMWSLLILLIGLPVASGIAGRRNPIYGPVGLVISMAVIVVVPYLIGQLVHSLVA